MPKASTTTSLTLTEARERLSPLIRSLSRRPVAISVHGKVRAYLISATRFAELEAAERASSRPVAGRIRGTLQITGDIAAGSRQAAAELEASASVRLGDPQR